MANIVEHRVLTPGARDALVNTGTSRMGATIPRGTSLRVRAELIMYGLVGTGDGLTRAGQIVREGIMEEILP